MLVLSRKIGEKLVIDGGITVTVTRIAGNRVTLGIEAPEDVRIVRGELEPTVNSFGSEPTTVPFARSVVGYEMGTPTTDSIPRLAK